MADPEEKQKATIRKRTPKKATAGIFDNLRQLPHPVEEFLGLVPPIEPAETAAVPTPPSEIVAPSEIDRQPLRNGPAAETAAPPVSAAPSVFVVPSKTPHTRVPNEIFDRVMPTLEPAAQVILWRLYRLSAGFDSLRCRVSLPKLADMVSVRPTQLRTHLKTLEARGYVKRLNVDLSNRNQQERGIEFEVRLPRLAGSESIGASKTGAGPKSVAPPKTGPNKEHTLKETHTNTASVGVASRFALKECRAYADSLKSEGIQNPGGYATKIHRTGEADELIERFLSPPSSSTAVDASQCPDCNGSGWWYPKGPEKGIARCKHERLLATTSGELPLAPKDER